MRNFNKFWKHFKKEVPAENRRGMDLQMAFMADPSHYLGQLNSRDHRLLHCLDHPGRNTPCPEGVPEGAEHGSRFLPRKPGLLFPLM